MGSTIRKRKMYEGFLSKVKILGKAHWFKSDIRGMFGNFPLSAVWSRDPLTGPHTHTRLLLLSINKSIENKRWGGDGGVFRLFEYYFV